MKRAIAAAKRTFTRQSSPVKRVRAFAVFAGTAFMTWASAASAQPATAAGTPPAASDQSRTAQDIEAGANVFGYSNSKFSFLLDCAELDSVRKGLDAEAAAYSRLSNGFSKFGDALTMVTATAQAAQGNYDDAIQTMGEAALDKAVCAFFPGPACVAWSAGRTAGSLIKELPWPNDPQGRTIGDVVLDAQVEALLPYLDQPMNVEGMRAAFTAFQSKQADLKRRQREAAEFGGQCKKEKETKSAVDELLAKAKANAASIPMTPADSGLSARTDAAISAGRANADSAIAAGNARLMSTMQDMQLQALQQQALQEQMRASQSGNRAIAPNLATTTPGQIVPAPAAPPPPQQPSCSNAEAALEGKVCVGN